MYYVHNSCTKIASLVAVMGVVASSNEHYSCSLQLPQSLLIPIAIN